MGKSISKTFAQFIATACEERGIKKGQLYLVLNRLGYPIQRSGPYAWFAGNQLPRSSRLPLIAEALKVSLTDLQAAYEESGGSISLTMGMLLENRALELDTEAINLINTIVERIGPIPFYLVEQLLAVKLSNETTELDTEATDLINTIVERIGPIPFYLVEQLLAVKLSNEALNQRNDIHEV